MNYTAERDRALMSLQARGYTPKIEIKLESSKQGQGYKWEPKKKVHARDLHITEMDVACPHDDHELGASMSMDAFLC